MEEEIDKLAMSYDDIEAALAKSKTHAQVVMAIMITWLCAGRVGDATQFRKEDFRLDKISDDTGFMKLRIVVRRGKAARLAQPHTIYTICPPQWATRLLAYLNEFEPTAPLFNRATAKSWGKLRAEITRVLRTNNKLFSQKALRRGALQTLAMNPSTDLATVRLFSGHTTDDMLLRYLNWGLHSNKQAAAGQKAALSLVGPTAEQQSTNTQARLPTAPPAQDTESSTDSDTTSSSDSSRLAE